MTSPHDSQSLITSGPIAFWDIAAALRHSISPEMIPDLTRAFLARKDTAERAEIVDLVGLLNSNESTQFLRVVFAGHFSPLARYYAARNLIERGDQTWHPSRAQVRQSEFYQSLLAYDAHVKGELSLPQIHALARERTLQPGDHWEWLTHLTAGATSSILAS